MAEAFLFLFGLQDGPPFSARERRSYVKGWTTEDRTQAHLLARFVGDLSKCSSLTEPLRPEFRAHASKAVDQHI
jgi:hypothetical protein